MSAHQQRLQTQPDFMFEKEHLNNVQKPFEFTRWANAPTVAPRLEKASYQVKKS
jgi:hypothetical protein